MEDCVGLDVMRLEDESYQEMPEEVANRQSEATLEVRQEHNTLTLLRSRLHFSPGMRHTISGGIRRLA